MTKTKRKFQQGKKPAIHPGLSLFKQMNPAQSRQARRIAYKAALAVIG